jgi:hypothetical protein
MSEIKVNKISPRTACGTTTLGDSGDTINIPAGVTISNSGTATGFGATGAVNWDVASIKTADFTGVAGVGYFVNTTGGAVIVTLPASPTAGDVIGVSDYGNNFNTANCTLNRNGSNIGGLAINGTLSERGLAVTLVFVDATKGWIVTDSGNQTEGGTATFIAASGGTVTESGDFKIHTFNSPGTFTVSSLGNAGGSTTVDYLVVAGGGGGGAGCAAGGGGGAGGMRFSFPNPQSGGHPVSAQGYPITVGAGGTAGPGPATASGGGCGSQGSSSIFDSITSAGGGLGGAGACSNNPGGAGGSGGGGGRFAGSGAGNTPAAPTPLGGPQGNPGGVGGGNGTPSPAPGGGGGGGRNAAGGTSPDGNTGGTGGAGTAIAISGSCITYAGGGGGGSYPASTAQVPGGAGGGGKGAPPAPPLSDMDGTANTGGGGGGGSEAPSYGTPTNDSPGGTGGSGIVVIRYKYQ